jgi:hypothetical protein
MADGVGGAARRAGSGVIARSDLPINASIAGISYASVSVAKLTDVPVAPARPVRPMR